MYWLFFAIWIIFNGRLTWEIALVGLVVAACIYWFMCRFMDWSIKKDKQLMHLSLYMVGYLGVLIWEIAKANRDTIRIIFSSKYEREPVLVTFRTRIQSPVLRVILANSITLTPGTITVSLERDEFVVHALDRDLTEGIEDSVFVRMLLKAEGLLLDISEKNEGERAGKADE